MSGIEYYAKEYEVQQLQEQVWELQSQVRVLEAKLDHVMTQTPIEPYNGVTTCTKCGMRWEGVMAYSCFLPDCPVQTKVTSQI
jgi:hypothetical protein